MHTTRQLAQRLEVNPQTIRRWSDTYQQHMSADSQRADSRQYSDDDLLLLWSVSRWRALGYSIDEIGQRLAQGERTSEPPPQAVDTDNQPQRAVTVTESVHTAALAEIRRLEADRDRLTVEAEANRQAITELNDRIAELRYQVGVLEGDLRNRPGLRFWLLVVAVAVVLTAIGAALLVGQG